MDPHSPPPALIPNSPDISEPLITFCSPVQNMKLDKLKNSKIFLTENFSREANKLEKLQNLEKMENCEKLLFFDRLDKLDQLEQLEKIHNLHCKTRINREKEEFRKSQISDFKANEAKKSQIGSDKAKDDSKNTDTKKSQMTMDSIKNQMKKSQISNNDSTSFSKTSRRKIATSLEKNSSAEYKSKIKTKDELDDLINDLKKKLLLLAKENEEKNRELQSSKKKIEVLEKSMVSNNFSDSKSKEIIDIKSSTEKKRTSNFFKRTESNFSNEEVVSIRIEMDNYKKENLFFKEENNLLLKKLNDTTFLKKEAEKNVNLLQTEHQHVINELSSSHKELCELEPKKLEVSELKKVVLKNQMDIDRLTNELTECSCENKRIKEDSIVQMKTIKELNEKNENLREVNKALKTTEDMWTLRFEELNKQIENLIKLNEDAKAEKLKISGDYNNLLEMQNKIIQIDLKKQHLKLSASNVDSKLNTPNSSDSTNMKNNFKSPKPFKPEPCCHEQLQVNMKKELEDIFKNNNIESYRVEEMFRNMEFKYEEQYKLNLEIKEHLHLLIHEKENLNFSKIERFCCKKEKELLPKKKEKKTISVLREKGH